MNFEEPKAFFHEKYFSSCLVNISASNNFVFAYIPAPSQMMVSQQYASSSDEKSLSIFSNVSVENIG